MRSLEGYGFNPEELVFVIVLADVSLVDLGNIQLSVLNAVQDSQVSSTTIQHQLHLLEQCFLQPEVYVVLLKSEVEDKHVGPTEVLSLVAWKVLDLLDDVLVQASDLVHALQVEEAHADQRELLSVLLDLPLAGFI